MEDAAILSAIFSDDEEEQDDGDNFESDTIGREDTMAKTLACAETLPTKYAADEATSDLEHDLQPHEENNGCTNSMKHGERPQSNSISCSKVTVLKATRKTTHNDPETAGKENIAVDNVCEDPESSARAKRRRPKREVSYVNTADDEATADSTSKRGSKVCKKLKLAPNTDKGFNDEGTQKSKTNSTKRGKSSQKKLNRIPDGQEPKGGDCQDGSCVKAKKSISRKMLTKTEKSQIMQHVRSLNPTAIAMMAINRVIYLYQTMKFI